MFMAGKSVPKIGEIRFGYVAESEAKTSVHKYIGIHPYLIVSNNIYNKKIWTMRGHSVYNKTNRQSQSCSC